MLHDSSSVRPSAQPQSGGGEGEADGGGEGDVDGGGGEGEADGGVAGGSGGAEGGAEGGQPTMVAQLEYRTMRSS